MFDRIDGSSEAQLDAVVSQPTTDDLGGRPTEPLGVRRTLIRDQGHEYVRFCRRELAISQPMKPDPTTTTRCVSASLAVSSRRWSSVLTT